jgi:hypothetical protein
VNGADETDRPISFGMRAQSLANVEVVLTDRVSMLSGTVVDDRARPVGGASVIVFPADRRQWYASSRYCAAPGKPGRRIHRDRASRGQLLCDRCCAHPDGRGGRVAGYPLLLESLLPGASTLP